jgi:hypothetical protein
VLKKRNAQDARVSKTAMLPYDAVTNAARREARLSNPDNAAFGFQFCAVWAASHGVADRRQNESRKRPKRRLRGPKPRDFTSLCALK